MMTSEHGSTAGRMNTRMRAFRRAAALLCVFALAAAGCAGMHPDARKMLQEPMNCGNPQGDIQILEDSRPGAFTRVTQGLQAVAPPMIVLSLLRDIVGIPFRSIYLDHWRVAFGTYDHAIDHRVSELKACGG
jgi:hypothetical protein